MIYKQYENLQLSALGMGAMRLPIVGDDYGKIDEKALTKMVAYAMENGINYYDTAWGYHNGQSEIALGKTLAQYPRESYFLADKFPGYDLSNMGKAEEIFEAQLVKCGVSYFDFYMLHNVCEMNIDGYLNPEYGICEYFLKQKESGRIHHLGFSAHGSYDVMERFLVAYGDKMEFCQIQLNYLDWTFQHANAKVGLLNKYGIPIWVMEPLRGGQLADLSLEDAVKLNAFRPDEKIPAWAFRFLMDIPGVVVILSGMSNSQQLQENIRTFEEEKPLNDVERKTLLGIADTMIGKTALPCTACRYCESHCPQQLNISNLIALYNEHCLTGGGFLAPMALMAMPENKQPNACIGCRSCEVVCPQQIKISGALKDFAEKLRV